MSIGSRDKTACGAFVRAGQTIRTIRNVFAGGRRSRFPLRGAMLNLLRRPCFRQKRVENSRFHGPSGRAAAMLKAPILFIFFSVELPSAWHRYGAYPDTSDLPYPDRSPRRMASSSCRVSAKGLTTVTPPQVNPSCMSSDNRIRQPACEATVRMTASQMLNW